MTPPPPILPEVSSPGPSVDAASGPPVLAVYATSLAPYELHLYKRVAAELPVRVQVLVARRDANRDWAFQEAPGVSIEDLSGGDRDTLAQRPPSQLGEWRRAAKVIDRLRGSGARALMMAGYNDVGRLRVAAWCTRRGVPVFIRSDSNYADEKRKSLAKRLVKRVFLTGLRAVSTLTFASGPSGVEYWRHYGHPARRLVVVPLEPDYALVESVTESEVAEAVARYGLDSARRRIVFAGRVTAQKRVDLLVNAFARIAAARPGWDVLVLGDGDLRAEIEASLPAGLGNRVRWAGFVAEQRDVSRLYRACDVLALPSDFEPWALVVNEAAAAGLAIVASDVVGAAPALVHEGRNGATFPRGDAAALAEALLRVTAPGVIDNYKRESRRVIAEWRSSHDPVAGIREALERSGVLPRGDG